MCLSEFDIPLDSLNSLPRVKLFPLGDKETKTLRHITYLEPHGWMTTQPDIVVRNVSIVKSLLAAQHHSVAGTLSHSQIMGYSAQWCLPCPSVWGTGSLMDCSLIHLLNCISSVYGLGSCSSQGDRAQGCQGKLATDQVSLWQLCKNSNEVRRTLLIWEDVNLVWICTPVRGGLLEGDQPVVWSGVDAKVNIKWRFRAFLGTVHHLGSRVSRHCYPQSTPWSSEFCKASWEKGSAQVLWLLRVTHW